MKRLVFPLVLIACGGGVTDVPDAATDAAIDHYGHKSFDASSEPDVAEEEAAVVKTPWNRMTSHGGSVVASPKIRALYVGPTKNSDALISWMVSSTAYWSVMSQYGVGAAEFLGSIVLDPSTFFQPDDIQGGFIDAGTLGWRIEQAVAALPPDEAGTANAYVVFLSGGVNVDLGDGKTCQWALGYHWTFGAAPYSVIPECGASGTTITHEIAEMVTDPSGGGWYSDADIQPAGGEIGDLCNFPISFEGKVVTALWSNADGDCEPYSQ
jgi:hypothetical protein